MATALPLITRREIVREMRVGAARTSDAVMRTLRDNDALSRGVSGPRRAVEGRLAGSTHLYCSLNRDAARALRLKHRDEARLFAGAAARVEALEETRTLASAVRDGADISSAQELARAFGHAEVALLVAQVQEAIGVERRELPALPAVTAMFGCVRELTETVATIAFEDPSVAPMSIPRALLHEEGLDQLHAWVLARWELMGDGMSLFGVEPAVETAMRNADGEPLVDMQGTPWGRVLSGEDARTAREVVEGPRRHSIRRPRARIQIAE